VSARKTVVRWRRDGAFYVGRYETGELQFLADRAFLARDGWSLSVIDPNCVHTHTRVCMVGLRTLADVRRAAPDLLAVYLKHTKPRRAKR
jgi:hypothetical protein